MRFNQCNNNNDETKQLFSHSPMMIDETILIEYFISHYYYYQLHVERRKSVKKAHIEYDKSVIILKLFLSIAILQTVYKLKKAHPPLDSVAEQRLLYDKIIFPSNEKRRKYHHLSEALSCICHSGVSVKDKTYTYKLKAFYASFKTPLLFRL